MRRPSDHLLGGSRPGSLDRPGGYGSPHRSRAGLDAPPPPPVRPVAPPPDPTTLAVLLATEVVQLRRALATPIKIKVVRVPPDSCGVDLLVDARGRGIDMSAEELDQLRTTGAAVGREAPDLAGALAEQLLRQSAETARLLQDANATLAALHRLETGSK